MAKSVNSTVLDAALNTIKTNAISQSACSAEPTTRTEANATYMLATLTISSTDFTLAAGDTSGRKSTLASKSGTVTNSGTATHVALYDASVLYLVTTCTSQALTAANSITFSSWKYEIQSPT